MDTTVAATPQPLRFARHVVGMMILALASPYVWYGSQGLMTWVSTWLTPLLFASLAFGLYYLFFTKRAKAAWPRSFFILAWVLLALVVGGPYLEMFNNRLSNQRSVQSPAPAIAPQVAPSNTTLAQPTAPSPPTGMQPATEQAKQPNYFDQFDNKDTYIARVKALRSAGETGSIQTIETRPPANSDNSLGLWPAPDVAKVEAGQTWWVTDGIVWIHVANHSPYDMSVITFDYTPGKCESATPTAPKSYRLHLQKPVAPRTEALIRFSANGTVQAADGCLSIVGVLG